MSKDKISQYDATAANNTDVSGVNIAEGCAPSGINNAIREVMAALKRFETGSDGDSITVGGNLVVSGSTTANTFTAGVINGTTVDTTNIEVTNIKAKDGTAAVVLTDSTGAVGISTALTANGGVVFNEAGANVDFRVEGDTDANLLFVDASADAIGIGTTNPGTVKFVVNRQNATKDEPVIAFTDGQNNTGYLSIVGSSELGESGAAFFADDALYFGKMISNVFTERMRINSAGDIQINGGGIYTRTTAQAIGIVANPTSADSTTRIELYGTTHSTNANQLFLRSNTIVFTDDLASAERMRIDSSGNVGIGTTSTSNRLEVVAGTGAQAISTFRTGDSTAANNAGGGFYANSSATAGSRYAYMWLDADGANFAGSDYGYMYKVGNSGILEIGNASNAAIVFGINNTERARITSGGYFKASDTGSYANAAGTYHEFRNSLATSIISTSSSNAVNPYGLEIRFVAATPNNTTNYFLYCDDSTNSKAIIYSDGSFQSRANSYGGISDVKLKQDIVDAGSQWDDIKGLRVRKFRMKDEVAADPNYPVHLGLIAQEAELVSPGLVFESPDMEEVIRIREVEKVREVEITPAVLDDDGNVIEPAIMETETYIEEEEYTERQATGTTTKSIKYSVLYMKAVKALQEAMARIEALEAEVQKLKGN